MNGQMRHSQGTNPLLQVPLCRALIHFAFFCSVGQRWGKGTHCLKPSRLRTGCPVTESEQEGPLEAGHSVPFLVNTASDQELTPNC